MSALDIEGVCAAYGRTSVLHDVDLEVEHGSITAVLGPSGSGKTTLLRVIAGFERATSGTVRVAGQVVEGHGRHTPPERRRLGYVAQDGALFPHLTVVRNIAFGLRRGPTRGRRIEELLALVGLSDFGGRYPHELSGGQQQRVALARAMAAAAPVILLDEPFAALDAALRTEVRDDIAAILRAAGTTAVLVTHDQDEALSLADQVAVLRAGHIVQSGTPSALYQQPHDPELARFLGAANLLPAMSESGRYRTALGLLEGWTPAAASGTACTVLVRPEQVQIAPADAATGGTRATVTAVRYHGHEVLVTMTAIADRRELTLVARTRPQPFLHVDAVVSVSTLGPVHAWSSAAPELTAVVTWS